MITALCYVARYDQKRGVWVQVRPFDGGGFVSGPLPYRDAGGFMARCREALPDEFRLFPLDALIDGRVISAHRWSERPINV